MLLVRSLLIEPYGIEIENKAAYWERMAGLLIEPYGIEIGQAVNELQAVLDF